MMNAANIFSWSVACFLIFYGGFPHEGVLNLHLVKAVCFFLLAMGALRCLTQWYKYSPLSLHLTILEFLCVFNLCVAYFYKCCWVSTQLFYISNRQAVAPIVLNMPPLTQVIQHIDPGKYMGSRSIPLIQTLFYLWLVPHRYMYVLIFGNSLFCFFQSWIFLPIFLFSFFGHIHFRINLAIP